ncbi:MAG TPA: DUF5996 family protein [Candidatus Baltobacteraceae bacterium]|nr:DUF5996 family protein [Candidatus Baltobacteraceae bacterium]
MAQSGQIGTFAWDDIDVGAWAPTKRALHRYAQMLGKIRVARSPSEPNWMFTALYLGARGFRTGAIPCGLESFEASVDVYSAELLLQRSDGREARIALGTAENVAAVYHALQRALDELDVECALDPTPQEIPDPTSLDEDTRPTEWDSAAVLRWFRVSTAVADLFQRRRARFFGRSGVQLWWGAFDLSLMLFNGKHAQAPADRGYLLKYDLDAELLNVGLYYGEENAAPFFYGYIHPEPPNAPGLAIAPDAASWSDALHEWVLPYESVRRSSDPAAAVNAFLDALVGHCFDAAGWDRAALAYEAPKRKHATLD